MLIYSSFHCFIPLDDCKRLKFVETEGGQAEQTLDFTGFESSGLLDTFATGGYR